MALLANATSISADSSIEVASSSADNFVEVTVSADNSIAVVDLRITFMGRAASP
jgi:hypothetical protein